MEIEWFTAFSAFQRGRGGAKLTTGREIASRRRPQKIKKSKSFTCRLVGTVRLFDFSLFWSHFDFSGRFDSSVFWALFGTFWDFFDCSCCFAALCFSTFRYGHVLPAFRDLHEVLPECSLTVRLMTAFRRRLCTGVRTFVFTCVCMCVRIHVCI